MEESVEYREWRREEWSMDGEIGGSNGWPSKQKKR